MESLNFWHWLILGAALLILEVFAPGAFFLWLAIAAGVVGGLMYLLPGLAWEYQVLIFSVLSVASIVLWRRYFRAALRGDPRSRLNRRGEQYIGRVFTLAEPIVNGLGKIRVDDSTWKVRGADCPTGTRVQVTGVDGTILEVTCLPRSAAPPDLAATDQSTGQTRG